MRTPIAFFLVAIVILSGPGTSSTVSAELSPASFATDKDAYYTAFDEDATITVTGLTECAGQRVELGALGDPVNESTAMVTVAADGSASATVPLVLGPWWPGVRGDCVPGGAYITDETADGTPVEPVSPVPLGVSASNSRYRVGETAELTVGGIGPCVNQTVDVGFFNSEGVARGVASVTLDATGGGTAHVVAPSGAPEPLIGIQADCLPGGVYLTTMSVAIGEGLAPSSFRTERDVYFLDFDDTVTVFAFGLLECAGQQVEFGVTGSLTTVMVDDVGNATATVRLVEGLWWPTVRGDCVPNGSYTADQTQDGVYIDPVPPQALDFSADPAAVAVGEPVEVWVHGLGPCVSQTVELGLFRPDGSAVATGQAEIDSYGRGGVVVAPTAGGSQTVVGAQGDCLPDGSLLSDVTVSITSAPLPPATGSGLALLQSAPAFDTDKDTYIGGETAIVTATGLQACAGQTIELGLYRDQQANDGLTRMVTVAADGTASTSASLPVAGFSGWAGARGDCIAGGFALSPRETFALPREQAAPDPQFTTDHLTYPAAGPVQVGAEGLTQCAGQEIELGLVRSEDGGTSIYNRVTVDDGGSAQTEITIPGHGGFVGWPGARAGCLDGVVHDEQAVVTGTALSPSFLYSDGIYDFGEPAAIGIIGLSQCAGREVELGFWRSGSSLLASETIRVDNEGRAAATVTVREGSRASEIVRAAVTGECVEGDTEFGGLLGPELITFENPTAPAPPETGSGLAAAEDERQFGLIMLGVAGVLLGVAVVLFGVGYRRRVIP